MEADADSIKCTRLFGKYVGICFQIKDDIFDYFDNEEIGKPTGNDMLEGRLTLPVIYALNTTDDESAKKIALKIKKREADLKEINELTVFAKRHKGIEYAHKMMNDYKEKALALLSVFPDTDVKRALVTYVDYMIERKK
jgi:octaprenyl-diphosphate synthase